MPRNDELVYTLVSLIYVEQSMHCRKLSYVYPLNTSMLIERFDSSYLGKADCTTS
jgi:hypothetical protein